MQEEEFSSHPHIPGPPSLSTPLLLLTEKSVTEFFEILKNAIRCSLKMGEIFLFSSLSPPPVFFINNIDD